MSHPPAPQPLEHAQARRLIDAYLVDDLAGPDAARLAAHVEGCPACAAEIGGATRLLALLGSLPTPPPAPDLDARIVAAALRDRDRRHEHRSWLAGLWTQIARGAVRTTGTTVVTIVTVALLGGAFVLAAGIITQVALGPDPRDRVQPDMTPTLPPTLVTPTAPATQPPAITVEPTPEPAEPTPARPTPAPPDVTAEPTPAPTEPTEPTPTPTPEPTPTPGLTPEPSPTPEPTEPTPTPTPEPTLTPEPTESPGKGRRPTPAP